MKSRKGKLICNIATSLIHQLVVIVASFILPRLFIGYYGSEVNGLISSITQFLGFITLCECGVGTVVQSALYKPLAVGDELAINQIYSSSERFFKRIAYILLAYIGILLMTYPFLARNQFAYGYTATLIVAIGINLWAQYYLGMSYKLILNADQKVYIMLLSQTLLVLANTIISVVLIMNHASVQMVKLASSCVFILQPLFLRWYVKQHYQLQIVPLDSEPIKQKWNGLAQHISAVVLGNTDIAILTLMSTLSNVSIYAVYALVTTGVKKIIVALTSGITATLGNMLAKKEFQLLERTFGFYEFTMHSIVTLAFSITAVLILPFITVYTKGITDVSYIKPYFAWVLTAAIACNCLRLPYNSMVLAAGHYKETQTSSIIEALLNIIVSVIFVSKFGLVGVAIGTLVAMLYRTIYLADYLSRGLVFSYRLSSFAKHLLIDIVVAWSIYAATSCFQLGSVTYASWLVLAVKVSLVATLVAILINSICYKKQMRMIWNRIAKTNKKRDSYEKD